MFHLEKILGGLLLGGSRRRCSGAKGFFSQPSMDLEKYGFNLYRFHVLQAGCSRLLLKEAAEREKAPF